MWAKFLANSGMGNNLLPESQITLKEPVSHTRAFVGLYLSSNSLQNNSTSEQKNKDKVIKKPRKKVTR